MNIKIDREKLKKRMEEKKEKAQSRRSRDPKDTVVFKVGEEGKHAFRAVVYPYGSDPSAEPFPERFYHYGLPGGTFYCPQKNAGEDCHICDFVWEKLKETKGTAAAKEWQKKLPSMCMLVPGVARGREEEGCKFFRVNTREDRPSDSFNKVMSWFLEEDTCQWLDPDEGFDMELSYKEPDESQAKFLNAKFLLSEMNLARKESKFGTKKEYKEFMENIPNLDEDVYPKKTTDDSLAVLEEWHKILARRATKNGTRSSVSDKSDGTSAVKTESDSKPQTTDPEDVADKLEALGM